MSRINSKCGMAVKVEASTEENLERVWRTHILPNAKAEVELPGARLARRGLVAVFVAYSQPKLNDLQQINVASQGLVVIV